VDKLKNRSKTDKQNFQMDLTPPETGHEINGPKHAQRSTIWINNQSGIMLSADDASSGLREIFYVIGNEKEKLFTGNPIQINEEGNYLFRYYSFDNVNNREGDNVFLLIVDNSPPDIQEIFSVSASETRADDNGEEVNVYPQFTTLFLAATDMSSGLNDVEYALNGGDFQPYLNQIICRETGRYQIHVKAKDNLGHVSEKEITFFIDKLR
jgi:hypothetical protein